MPLAAMPLTPGKLNCNCRQRNPSMPYNLCMMTMMMMMCDFFFLQRRTILIFSIFQKQWKSTQNLTEQIFEKPFYLQFNWQKLRWTRIKKIYKFLLQTQRDENIEWLSNSIHETIRFAFCTLYSSPYCLWSESISAKWLFWAVAAATNEHKTNTEKNRKTQKKNQMKTKHILDSISYEDTNPPTVERPLLRHTNYFHSNHAQFDKEVNISQFPSSNETKKKNKNELKRWTLHVIEHVQMKRMASARASFPSTVWLDGWQPHICSRNNTTLFHPTPCTFVHNAGLGGEGQPPAGASCCACTSRTKCERQTFADNYHRQRRVSA